MTREIAGTSVSFELEATRDIYARIAYGGAETCNCQPCRNYRLVRDEAYPPEFRTLLEELGIDYRKELEVYFGVPLPGGKYLYEGWFCFAGKAYGRIINAMPAGTAFKYRIDESAPSPQREFHGHSVLHLAFQTTVPWRLSEPWTLGDPPPTPIG